MLFIEDFRKAVFSVVRAPDIAMDYRIEIWG